MRRGAPSAIAPAAKDGGAPANGQWRAGLPTFSRTMPSPSERRGIASYRSGDFRAAIADLDQAIRLDPTFESAYIDRGQPSSMP